MRFLNPRERMRTTGTHFQPNVGKVDIYLIGFRRESGSKRGSFTLRMPPLNIYGSILPQRGKKSQKSDIFNLKMSLFAICTWQRDVIPFHIVFCPRLRPPICASTVHLCCPYLCVRLRTRASRTDVCTYARIPTAMLFFCCHKCHTKGEIDAKTVVFLGGR